MYRIRGGCAGLGSASGDCVGAREDRIAGFKASIFDRDRRLEGGASVPTSQASDRSPISGHRTCVLLSMLALGFERAPSGSRDARPTMLFADGDFVETEPGPYSRSKIDGIPRILDVEAMPFYMAVLE